MFGDKGVEIEKWISSGKWDKIEKKYLYSNEENRLILAKALAETRADEAYNILVDLIKDEDKDVQLEAIKSLGMTGSDRAAAQLQWVLSKTPATNKATLDALQTAITNVRKKR